MLKSQLREQICQTSKSDRQEWQKSKDALLAHTEHQIKFNYANAEHTLNNLMRKLST
jgi:hypothetical protein